MRTAAAIATASAVAAIAVVLPALPAGAARVVPPPPRLLVPPTTPGQPQGALSLEKADVRVTVTGFLARTRMTLTFRNDAARVLEGTLDFPLPENAALSGYGLDVNGEIVDAVPVEKHEARIAFEKEVRRGVDPGLVEQTVGNNFRTRVYPIPAKGTRTVRVEWVSDLGETGGDRVYTVPLRWNLTVPLAHVTVEVGQAPDGSTPLLRFAGLDRPLTFEQRPGGRYVAERTLENIPFADDLSVVLPGAAGKSQAVVEPFTRASAEGSEFFFAIRDVAPIPVDKAAQLTTRPRRIGVVWDASLSRRESDAPREIALLAAHLRRLGTVEVDVVVLRHEAERPRRFRVTNGDPTAVITFLRNTPFDGGTNLSALHLPQGTCSYWIAFTDGLSTLGEQGLVTGAGAPVYTVSTDPKANHPLLRRLGADSGGAYFNLSEPGPTAAQIATNIGVRRYSLLSVSVAQGSVSGIHPVGRRPAQGEPTVVSGKLLSPAATVTLNYGFPGQVLARRTYNLRQSRAAATGLVGRFWAQQKAADLSALPEKNHDTLLALGQDFNIVTPATSLLVLETLNQYLEHDITPPKSRPSIYAAYMAQRAEKRKATQKEQGSKLQQVVALWREKVAWWERTYHKAAPRVTPAQAEAARTGRVFAVSASEPQEADLRANEVNRARIADGMAGFAGGAAGGPAPGGAPPPPRPESESRRRVFAPARAAAASANMSSDYAAERHALHKAKDGGAGDEGAEGASITIKPWSPDTPYLAALRRAKTGTQAYQAFLRERRQWGTAPAFYLDCAEVLRQKGETRLALRVLTDITDLQLEEPQLLRIVAHRLQQIGKRDMAISLFEKVRRMRPEEPQSYRDLALALADRADAQAKSDSNRAMSDYNRALSLLARVVMGRWDRFQEIETIALMEANRIVARAKPLASRSETRLVVPLDSRLVKNLPCDVRILMTWDTDQTDMDLHILEPTGEDCYYGHNRSSIGGRLSRDFTQGYGPEEYLLRRAQKGGYKIQSNYFGTHQQTLTGGTTVQATVITDWGRPTERRRHLTLRLSREKETVDIGAIRL